MNMLRDIFDVIFTMLILFELSEDHWAKVEKAKVGAKVNRRGR